MLTDNDLQAIWLTARLAGITTLILLLFGTPLAWWLARCRSWWKGPLGAIVALPLVLPPSVLGFYLLLAMGPNGPVGQMTASLGLGTLPFTFWGLVVASSFYSLHLAPRSTAQMDTVSSCFQCSGKNLLVHQFFKKWTHR